MRACLGVPATLAFPPPRSPRHPPWQPVSRETGKGENLHSQAARLETLPTGVFCEGRARSGSSGQSLWSAGKGKEREGLKVLYVLSICVVLSTLKIFILLIPSQQSY